MRFPNRLTQAIARLLVILISSVVIPAQVLTVKELREMPDLTPDKFATCFNDFKFELSEKVQPQEVFLKRQVGDCDDYATLASDILKEKGYTTKLVVVFMPKDIHVVCYVAETKSYLDFNYRNQSSRTVPATGTLDDIAEKVAKSFKSSWHCVSEFTFNDGARHFVYTDFPQAKPAARKTVPAQSGPQAIASASLMVK